VNESGEGSSRNDGRWRSRRHRRNRLIRRWLAAGFGAFLVACASAIALEYLSPSLFHADLSAPPTFEQAELSRERVITLNQLLTPLPPSSDRPVFRYSVVPGGVRDAKELKWVAEHDPVVAAHYAGFDYDHARVVRLTLARTAYISYRIGNRVYWTRRRVTLHKGEKVITDGRITARTRCANRVEEVPQQAASPVEPPVVKFDEPQMDGGTALKAPPVPYQSALLDRPVVPGIKPTGPLSFYTPLLGGTWVAVSSPPLPEGLCGPGKKKPGSESGCCFVGQGTKKKPVPCGSHGVVPEPSTWILFASGLALIYWQSRRRFMRASPVKATAFSDGSELRCAESG